MTSITVTSSKRFGKRWTINECIQLQREFELLELPIDEIAKRHERTSNAIMFKLDQEGLANYNTLYNNYYSIANRVHLNVVENEENEVDDDKSSDYQEESESGISESDESSISEEDESESEGSESDESEEEDLRLRVDRIENRLNELTQLINKCRNKTRGSLFSLFA
jgi:hypothetical protein